MAFLCPNPAQLHNRLIDAVLAGTSSLAHDARLYIRRGLLISNTPGPFPVLIRNRYNGVMLLILTHEKSDFDAIASQLGAHKLFPDGIPLLPRHLNRNVQQFLNLYWDTLPRWLLIFDQRKAIRLLSPAFPLRLRASAWDKNNPPPAQYHVRPGTESETKPWT